MLFYMFSIFNLATLGLSITGESTFPVTTCKRDSIDYSICFKQFLEKAWPQIVQGYPKFDFPSLDPLFYKYGKIILNTGQINGELIMSNLTAIGLTKTQFSDIRTHYHNDVFRLEIDVLVPKIFVEGTYEINGSINIFKAIGKGYFNVTGDDVRGTWDLTGRIINDTWIVERFLSTPSIGKLNVYTDNLFDSGKELNDVILIFVNEFWPAIYRAMLPFMTNLWDTWLTKLSNKFLSKLSFSIIFP